MKEIIDVPPGDIIEVPAGASLRDVVVAPVPTNYVMIDVATLETLAHGGAFARDVAQTLHTHFNDPAMQRTQQKIHAAQKEAMRLVGIARRPR